MSHEPLPAPFLQLDENAQPSRGGWFQTLSRSVALRLIILTYVFTAVVLTGILLVFGYLLSRDAQAQADEQISSSVQTLATNYSIWLESSQNALLNLAAQPDIQSMQAERQQPVLAALAQTHPYMYLVSTVDLSGVNVARSDLAEPINYAERNWFQEASKGAQIAYQTVIGRTSGLPGLVVSTPIYREGVIVGVAMYAADLEQVSRIVEQARLGETGVAYVVDPMNRVVAHPETQYSSILSDFSSYPPVSNLRQGVEGLQSFQDAAGVEWRAATALLPGGWGVVVQQRAEEATAKLRREQLILIISGLASLVVILILIWVVAQRSLKPISELTQSALAVSAGNFFRLAIVKTNDEFATLAGVFNRMVVELRDLVQGLEQRVSERTSSLERRTTYLEAAAQVARSAAAIRDLNQLLTDAVILISERFGYYHAGIFIIDELNEYAVLLAANSPGGQRMLERGHKLRIGQVGIVGYVADSGRPRIALDVGVDAVYFNNPDLPQTRSEMALPLKVSGRVIGVLDVQSLQPNAFAQEGIEVLQILADQIGLAIENARLLQESQQALAELNAIYGERTRQTWQDRLQHQSFAYRYDRTTVRAVRPKAVKKAAKDTRVVELPISLRGQSLGSIRMRRGADQNPWTDEEKELIQEALSRVAPALENARLLEEIQQRAYQESLIAQFSTRIQSSLDLESVLRTAVSEIASAVSAPRVRIRLGSEREHKTQEGEASNHKQSPEEPSSTDGNGSGPKDASQVG